MRNDQPVYVVVGKDDKEIRFIDESFVNLQRVLDVEKQLPAKKVLAKLRAGLTVDFEHGGNQYTIIRWDLKTGKLDEPKAKEDNAKQAK